MLVLSTSWSWWCVGSKRPESPRSVHEFYSLKDSQINKVHTSSHEITIKPYKSSNYENIDKTTTSDSLNNDDYYDDYDAQTNTSDVEKIKTIRFYCVRYL